MAGKANIRNQKFAQTRVKNIVSAKSRGVAKGDARLKIIQKKRSKLVDARDRLDQIKKSDARARILKLRQERTKGDASIVRPVGSSILMKTDRNGKISLSTNKAKKSGFNTDINSAIRKELGLMNNQRKNSPQKGQIIRQVQRTNATAPLYREEPLNRFHRDIEMTEAFTPPVIKRTIRNDIIRDMPPLPDFSHARLNDPSLYTWIRPGIRHSMHVPMKTLDEMRPSMEVTARNNLSEADWNYADPNVRSIKLSPMYMEEEELVTQSPPRSASSLQRLKTGVHARLDTPPSTAQSQGIFAQTKTKVVVPVGHRIVVSNLQSTVTQEDIRELFEDIGELLVSRLVRTGTAEVIYKNLKDAQKAVETYHNRQLDGQPMKCLLVNKRPVNNPTAPAVHSTKSNSSSVLRTSGGVVKKSSSTVKSSKLVPDISTIHKVLFHKT